MLIYHYYVRIQYYYHLHFFFFLRTSVNPPTTEPARIGHALTPIKSYMNNEASPALAYYEPAARDKPPYHRPPLMPRARARVACARGAKLRRDRRNTPHQEIR